MYQTLIHIWPTLLEVPIFGFGWALAIWSLIAVAWLGLLWSRPETRKELPSAAVLMAIVAVALAWVMPMLEEIGADGQSDGVPIRGYGLMLLLGIVLSVLLAMYRARQMGLDPEIMLSLAFWLIFAGIAGARLFYVVQKWEQFQKPTWGETFAALFDVVGGGLVVYGSAIGALAALFVFCYRRKLPALAIADLIAPSMMVGLAIGRIGCLLNGCCYGGLCNVPELAVQFPPKAPAYEDQLVSGMLFGFRLADASGPEVTVEWVEPNSAAEKAGLAVGKQIDMIDGATVNDMAEAHQALVDFSASLKKNVEQDIPTVLSLHSPDGSTARWLVDLPARSLPIHPTQVYSAIDAGLLALLLWFFYPFRRHDGEVIALLFTLHPISRFVLEIIRIDEGGALGTSFTISQLVGFLFLAFAIGLWIVVARSPRGSALPPRTAALAA